LAIDLERRLLQLAVAAACIVPFSIGGLGVLRGPAILRGVGADVPADLDSHFRYLSGLLLGIGILYLCAIPTLERRTALFRLLCAIIVAGGLGRLLSLIQVGVPGPGHQFGLVMELGVVPAITWWQARVARLWAARPQT
jgi:hypothetical protein